MSLLQYFPRIVLQNLSNCFWLRVFPAGEGESPGPVGIVRFVTGKAELTRPGVNEKLGTGSDNGISLPGALPATVPPLSPGSKASRTGIHPERLNLSL